MRTYLGSQSHGPPRAALARWAFIVLLAAMVSCAAGQEPTRDDGPPPRAERGDVSEAPKAVAEPAAEPAAEPVEVAPEPVTEDPKPEAAPAKVASGCKPISDQPRFRPLPDPSVPWCTEDGETLLTFFHITDTHVGKEPKTADGEPTRDEDAFRAVVEAMNAMRLKTSPEPQFAVITGDLTDSWKSSQIRGFKATLEELSVPAYVSSGNHDVTFDPKLNHMKSWKRWFPKATLPQAVDLGPIVLIGYDSQIYNARRKSDEVDEIADEQWVKLRRAVKKAHKSGKRIFLHAHIPALPSLFRTKVVASWKTKYLKRFQKLVKDYEVEASLTGHFHRDETYVVGKTFFLNAPPVSRWETRDSSYRIIRVLKGGLAYRQIYLGPDAKARSYEVDLRGVTQEGMTRWAAELDAEELRQVWEMRYAGDDASERMYGDLLTDHFRAFFADPFAYQPTKGRKRRLDP